ncbi:uncharacterized protein V1518DRAFT_426312 [Limtongia smithiae]|uniref:uncharacterized protein n=1 Tax=Limtongia smithiae TaxID=1125753 RepID=UPI0034CD7D0A
MSFSSSASQPPSAAARDLLASFTRRLSTSPSSAINTTARTSSISNTPRIPPQEAQCDGSDPFIALPGPHELFTSSALISTSTQDLEGSGVIIPPMPAIDLSSVEPAAVLIASDLQSEFDLEKPSASHHSRPSTASSRDLETELIATNYVGVMFAPSDSTRRASISTWSEILDVPTGPLPPTEQTALGASLPRTRTTATRIQFLLQRRVRLLFRKRK